MKKEHFDASPGSSEVHCASIGKRQELRREEGELPYVTAVGHWISSVPLWNLTEASETELRG